MILFFIIKFHLSVKTVLCLFVTSVQLDTYFKWLKNKQTSTISRILCLDLRLPMFSVLKLLMRDDSCILKGAILFNIDILVNKMYQPSVHLKVKHQMYLSEKIY